MAAIAASANDSAARNLLGDGPADKILAAAPDRDDRTALTRATLYEAQARWLEFCNGVAQYQRHPFQRAGLSALRDQLAAMQKQLDSLGKN